MQHSICANGKNKIKILALQALSTQNQKSEFWVPVPLLNCTFFRILLHCSYRRSPTPCPHAASLIYLRIQG